MGSESEVGHASRWEVPITHWLWSIATVLISSAGNGAEPAKAELCSMAHVAPCAHSPLALSLSFSLLKG